MATILLATEDNRCADVFAAELESAGHRVISAITGQEAYERTTADAPELVFVDTNLAIFNGFETCRILRADPAVTPQLPIYLLTETPVDPRLVEKAGLTGCFPKAHDTCVVRDLLAAHALYA